MLHTGLRCIRCPDPEGAGLVAYSIRYQGAGWAHRRLSRVQARQRSLKYGVRFLRRIMKRLVKKAETEDPKLRKEFESWFQQELKKSIREDREVLETLD